MYAKFCVGVGQLGERQLGERQLGRPEVPEVPKGTQLPPLPSPFLGGRF